MDTLVELHCHICDNWQKTKASDGQRVRCNQCKTNLQVIRDENLHPASRIGLNVRPVTPSTSLAVRTDSPAPRRVIQGTVTDNTVTVRSMASDVSTAVKEHRVRKAVKAAREANPFRGLQPPDANSQVCVMCADAGNRPNGRFPLAEFDVITVFHFEHFLVCVAHYKMLSTAHLLTKAMPIYRKPNPGPNYRSHGIGDVPESPLLPALREQAAQREQELELEQAADTERPGIVNRIADIFSRYHVS